MTHDFTIPALSCGHCVRAVTEAVQAADPASVIRADPASKQVAVETTLARDDVATLLTDAGYAPA